MQQIYRNYPLPGLKPVLRTLIIALLFSFQNFNAAAQCPVNIGFEDGTFNGWQCLTGTFNAGNITVNPTAPIPGRHDIISAATLPAVDPYGGFPVLCPNGSNYSIRIGVQNTGTNADGVSYTLTIPPGQDKFRLIYNYALVINNGGGHGAIDQPRLRVVVKNLTDNTVNYGCDSMDIAYSNANPLPGFQPEPNIPSQFRWKPWAARSINLDNNAGKTIQLTFIATGCGLTNGTHFGYAYLDLNSTCSGSFDGAIFCPDDASVTVNAPPGYQSYNWYNGLMTQLLGTGQSITLSPPPLSGDSLKIELIPYPTYGCTDTLTAYLWDTLTVHSYAGPNRQTCDNNPVQLGYPPEPNRLYKWTPVTGLSDPNISNPIATPSVTTTYTLTVTTAGGGCATQDEVDVKVDILSDSIQQIGPSSHCAITGETVELKVLPHDKIQWYNSSGPIPGATSTSLFVTQTGAYYAIVSSNTGCSRTTKTKQIDVWASPVAGFTNNAATQCDKGHQFVFTNTSTLATGTLQYLWDMGDGNTYTTADVTHSYAKPGAYNVKLLVTAPGGCTDTRNIDVLVNPSPVSAFVVDEPIQCFKDNWFIFNNRSTVSAGVLTYTWDFGDGNFDYSNDIAHHYAVAGTYNVKLSAKETSGGCTTDSIFKVLVQQSPVANFTIDNNIQCFPGHVFTLTNGTTITSDPLAYTWDMGDGVIKTGTNLTYSYAKAGNYTIKLLAATPGGCNDSISYNVIVHPVPAADFTIRPVCENLRVPIINRTFNNTTSTVNYLWDFGNGHTDNVKTPVYSYPAAGTYIVKLSVSTAECPVSFDVKTASVTIDPTTPGVVYPDKDAAFNFPEQLQARSIGTTVTWTPPVSLSNRYSFSPVFKGIAPQLYTIELKTANGCITVDTQLVKTHKKIEIYVPTGFTPNGDGTNDRLRPILIGFTKVNYFRVYNRWGGLLFSMNSDLPGWDGKINNKPAETQTVVWMIEAVDVDGVVHSKQGTTVLYR
ncbi:PKD domain-containing protein [Ferruginibacter sp. SUN106]|uniref:PKD domain-containing protein n=1 Tax=Ferruginibacter sp. SUN106 TaxID=2978348 RepID=UPI003D35DF1E